MTKSRFRRRLSLSLEKMLASYSLAGAATLGSVCAPPGECAVVYTSIHAVRSTTNRTPVSLPLDLNHDGSVDFQITASRFHFYSSFNAGQIGYLKVIPMGGNQIVNSAGNHYADAFNVGAEISPALNFVSPFSDYALLGIFFSADGYGSIVDGQFPNTRNKFVALKLSQNGQDFYGWARVNVRQVGPSFTFELVDYAYQNTSNEPILAGEGIPGSQVSSLDSLPPQTGTLRPTGGARMPATLGALAAGDSAIALWRRLISQ